MTVIIDIRIINGVIEVRRGRIEFIPGGQAFMSEIGEWEVL